MVGVDKYPFYDIISENKSRRFEDGKTKTNFYCCAMR